MGRTLESRRLFSKREMIWTGLWITALTALFHVSNGFERFVALLERYEAWQLDEFVFALLLLGMSGLVVALLRTRELRREMNMRQMAEYRAETLARHDALTGLANRRLLGAGVPALLDEAAATGREAAVLMVDLDHFKPVNDAGGHEAGDAVLVEVASRLQRVAGAQGLVARTGGDEFVLAFTHEPGTDAPARLASQIIRSIGEPFLVFGRYFEIGASIGIARCPANGARLEELIRAADIAMYEGKRAGRNAYRFFDAGMDERLRARREIEDGLRDALQLGQITAYFQPVMSLAEQRIVGFEALARWQHPERGLIMPEQFVSIAEDLGLIDQLTFRVLREGCKASRDWSPDTTLSINISPLQLRDEWLATRLVGVLTEMGFPPSRLIVEVTENAIIDDIGKAAEVFAALQNAGIRVALDDFGKGYSSLSHLRQLRFNHLKIDSSFVRSMDSLESQKIVSAVAGLGKALGMPVTAEGVESAAIAQALMALGCEQAQGFLFGPPAPAGQVAWLMEDRKRA